MLVSSFWREPNRVLDKKYQTKHPGIIGWNLIQLVYKVFVEKYGEGKFNSFNVQQELTHSYFLSSVYIIMLRFQKGMIMECSLFIIRLTRTLNLPPGNQLTWLKKPDHL